MTHDLNHSHNHPTASDAEAAQVLSRIGSHAHWKNHLQAWMGNGAHIRIYTKLDAEAPYVEAEILLSISSGNGFSSDHHLSTSDAQLLMNGLTEGLQKLAEIHALGAANEPVAVTAEGGAA